MSSSSSIQSTASRLPPGWQQLPGELFRGPDGTLYRARCPPGWQMNEGVDARSGRQIRYLVDNRGVHYESLLDMLRAIRRHEAEQGIPHPREVEGSESAKKGVEVAAAASSGSSSSRPAPGGAAKRTTRTSSGAAAVPVGGGAPAPAAAPAGHAGQSASKSKPAKTSSATSSNKLQLKQRAAEVLQKQFGSDLIPHDAEHAPLDGGESKRNEPAAEGGSGTAANPVQKNAKRVKRTISNFVDKSGAVVPPPFYGETTQEIWRQKQDALSSNNIKHVRAVETLNAFKRECAEVARESGGRRPDLRKRGSGSGQGRGSTSSVLGSGEVLVPGTSSSSAVAAAVQPGKSEAAAQRQQLQSREGLQPRVLTKPATDGKGAAHATASQVPATGKGGAPVDNINFHRGGAITTVADAKAADKMKSASTNLFSALIQQQANSAPASSSSTGLIVPAAPPSHELPRTSLASRGAAKIPPVVPGLVLPGVVGKAKDVDVEMKKPKLNFNFSPRIFEEEPASAEAAPSGRRGATAVGPRVSTSANDVIPPSNAPASSNKAVVDHHCESAERRRQSPNKRSSVTGPETAKRKKTGGEANNIKPDGAQVVPEQKDDESMGVHLPDEVDEEFGRHGPDHAAPSADGADPNADPDLLDENSLVEGSEDLAAGVVPLSGPGAALIRETSRSLREAEDQEDSAREAAAAGDAGVEPAGGESAAAGSAAGTAGATEAAAAEGPAAAAATTGATRGGSKMRRKMGKNKQEDDHSDDRMLLEEVVEFQVPTSQSEGRGGNRGNGNGNGNNSHGSNSSSGTPRKPTRKFTVIAELRESAPPRRILTCWSKFIAHPFNGEAKKIVSTQSGLWKDYSSYAREIVRKYQELKERLSAKFWDKIEESKRNFAAANNRAEVDGILESGVPAQLKLPGTGAVDIEGFVGEGGETKNIASSGRAGARPSMPGGPATRNVLTPLKSPRGSGAHFPASVRALSRLAQHNLSAGPLPVPAAFEGWLPTLMAKAMKVPDGGVASEREAGTTSTKTTNGDGADHGTSSTKKVFSYQFNAEDNDYLRHCGEVIGGSVASPFSSVAASSSATPSWIDGTPPDLDSDEFEALRGRELPGDGAASASPRSKSDNLTAVARAGAKAKTLVVAAARHKSASSAKGKAAASRNSSKSKAAGALKVGVNKGSANKTAAIKATAAKAKQPNLPGGAANRNKKAAMKMKMASGSRRKNSLELDEDEDSDEDSSAAEDEDDEEKSATTSTANKNYTSMLLERLREKRVTHELVLRPPCSTSSAAGGGNTNTAKRSSTSTSSAHKETSSSASEQLWHVGGHVNACAVARPVVLTPTQARAAAEDASKQTEHSMFAALAMLPAEYASRRVLEFARTGDAAEIQIWEIGTSSSAFSQRRFTLCHDGGFSRDLAFVRCTNPRSAKGLERRLGLLAVLRGDGRLQIFSLGDDLRGKVSLQPVWQATKEAAHLGQVLGSGSAPLPASMKSANGSWAPELHPAQFFCFSLHQEDCSEHEEQRQTAPAIGKKAAGSSCPPAGLSILAGEKHGRARVYKPKHSLAVAMASLKASGSGSAAIAALERVQVFGTQTRQAPITACAFCPAGGSFVIGDARGVVYYYTLEAAFLPHSVFQANQSPILELLWSRGNAVEIFVRQWRESQIFNLLEGQFQTVLSTGNAGKGAAAAVGSGGAAMPPLGPAAHHVESGNMADHPQLKADYVHPTSTSQQVDAKSRYQIWSNALHGIECGSVCEAPDLGFLTGWSTGDLLWFVQHQPKMKQKPVLMQRWELQKLEAEAAYGTGRTAPPAPHAGSSTSVLPPILKLPPVAAGGAGNGNDDKHNRELHRERRDVPDINAAVGVEQEHDDVVEAETRQAQFQPQIGGAENLFGGASSVLASRKKTLAVNEALKNAIIEKHLGLLNYERDKNLSLVLLATNAAFCQVRPSSSPGKLQGATPPNKANASAGNAEPTSATAPATTATAAIAAKLIKQQRNRLLGVCVRPWHLALSGSGAGTKRNVGVPISACAVCENVLVTASAAGVVRVSLVGLM